MNVRTLTVVLVLGTVAFASPLVAQSTQFELGIGYQWLDVTGNKDLYRTHTGQDSGVLLDTLDLNVTGKNAPYDHLRLTASGFGANPDRRFHLTAERAGVYNLRVGYDRAEVFSAYPDYANPFAAQGIVPGQHTLDRARENVNLDLEIFPGKTITPLLGYTRSRYKGPAATTYHVGEDEFRLASDLDETVDEYRVGVAFALGAWRASVLQGWRSLDSNATFTLAEGEKAGNNSRPVLGKDIYVDTFTRRTKTSVDAPFTTAYVTGRIGDAVRLVGNYARADAEADNSDFETLGGQFASFEIARFFTGLDAHMTGKAESPSWRGELRAEIDLLSWLDLTAGYTSSHRELDGRAFVDTSYGNAVTFSGANPGNINTVLSAATAWERDEDVARARLTAHPASWVRLWVGWAQADQDVTVTPDAAEIVVPGGQGGAFSRNIDRWEGGAQFDLGALTLAADYSSDDADTAVIRSDYLDRDRLRMRAALKIGGVVRISGTGENIKASNPTPGVNYDSSTWHYAVDVEMTPIEAVAVRAGYDTYSSDSKIVIREPQDFSLGRSIYAEDGESIEGSVVLKVEKAQFEFGAWSYENRGDQPFDLTRTFARFDVPLGDSFGVYGQFERRKYEETRFALANYEADRYGLFLRWSMK